MIRHLSMLTAALLVILAAAPAGATDDTRGRWWRVPQIAENLQLSAPEIRQLDDAFEAARIRMIELKGKVEVEQQKLSALMEKIDFNEAAVREQHRAQEAARLQLANERFEFLLEVRGIIGHDRFVKLLEIREERRKERHLRKAAKESGD